MSNSESSSLGKRNAEESHDVQRTVNIVKLEKQRSEIEVTVLVNGISDSENEHGDYKLTLLGTTRFEEVMDKFCTTNNIPNIKFMYKEKVVAKQDTPAGLGMEHGSEIYAYHQYSCIIKSSDYDDLEFSFYGNQKMGSVFKAFNKKVSVQDDTFRFLFDGIRVSWEKTPFEIDMDHTAKEYIDAMATQVGG